MQISPQAVLPASLALQQFTFRLKHIFTHWMVVPLIAFLITRLLVGLGAFFAYTDLNTNGQYLGFEAMWSRWDAEHYIAIVDQGYTYTPDPQHWSQARVVFFPAYLILVSMVKPFVAGNTVLAGLIVSNACFFLTLVYLYRLAQFEFGDFNAARRAIFYIAAFPVAVFFSAVYTESVFLLFTVAAFYYVRRRWWGKAALLGILSTATRVPGVFVVMFALLEWLDSHGWNFARIHRAENWQRLWQAIRNDFVSLLLIASMSLGLVGYMLFLWLRFDDPLAFLHAQSIFNRQQVGPIVVSINLLKMMKFHLLESLHGNDVNYHLYTFFLRGFDYFLFLCTLVICIPMWRRLGKNYAIYSAVSILLPMFSDYNSISRYVMGIFPVFLMLGWWGATNDRLNRLLLIAFPILMIYFAWQQLSWNWVA
jgi:hypothetical protein